MGKKYDLLDMSSGEWYKVGDEYLGTQVIKMGEITELQEEGKKLFVTYKNGKTISFDNCYGTWGFPTRIC